MATSKLTNLSTLLSPRKVKIGSEIRRATLYTELTIDGTKFNFEALGARSCKPTPQVFSRARGTDVFNLTCDLTYFAAEHPKLGSIKIIQDPRIVTRGQILLRKNDQGKFQLPGLSYFNQHLIFHIGDRFFYYPAAWQVVASIIAWPPEFHQYHHLEEDTPIFDFITGEPNIARKGISTISILDKLSAAEEKAIRADHAKEIKVIKGLPATKLSPIDKTPAQ